MGADLRWHEYPTISRSGGPAPREFVLQFRTAHAAMTRTSLTVHDVYSHYLNSGGPFDEIEVDAYLHGLMPLPREDRDCVAQAVNELIDDLAAAGAFHDGPRASYSRTPGRASTASVRQRLPG